MWTLLSVIQMKLSFNQNDLCARQQCLSHREIILIRKSNPLKRKEEKERNNGEKKQKLPYHLRGSP